ncbi:uncharacterized protein [Dysidea avara]|uniref:uncharacterized protein n=1 Tax=Dysidea avara TaxID=196820 RepID=UPI00331D0209
MPVASDKPGSLRFMFDKVNVHIRGLKSLGVASEQYGSFLIPMIMSKLPDDIRLRVARESRQDVWKIEEILEVVKVEVEAREASESVKVNPQHNQNVGFSHKSSHYTANSLYAGSGKPGSDERIEVVAIGFPVICSSLPTQINLSHYTHLEGLELADNLDQPKGEIDVLIGSDFYWNIVTEGLSYCDKGPIAINSKLGWLLSGPIYHSSITKGTLTSLILTDSGTELTNTAEDDGLTHMLKRFWDTDSIVQYKNGHYEVSLLWRRDCSELSNHFNISYNRLKYLHQRLLKRPEILQEYNNIIQEQHSKGIIERVETCDTMHIKSAHYLPHHAIIRTERETTKLRIVYDGSAKSDAKDLSLNDFLDTGPNYIPKLFELLLRFRCHRIALVGDIEKAFLMIGIAEDDREKLRFLWLKNPFEVNSEIVEYRFNKLVFGLRPSPAILGAVISNHLLKYKSDDPNMVKLIQNSLYVDDLVCGETSIERAFKVYRTSKRMMSEGGFNLRK